MSDTAVPAFPADNPLLQWLLEGGTEADLPPFDRFEPEQVEPALDWLLADNRRALGELLSQPGPHDWDGLMAPLEALDDRLGRLWSPVSHLNSVANSEALRAAYNACLPKLSDYATEMGQNEALWAAIRGLVDVGVYADLDPARQRVVDNTLRDFRLAGVDLPAAEKARYKAIAGELSALASRFQENVLDATQAWTLNLADEARLAGLPESARAQARQAATEREQAGWTFTLDAPAYLAVMTHADDRELRRELYTAWGTRASDQGPHAGEWDNGEVMERTLALRHELARLVGFNDYSEYSLATKMARDPDEVVGFLRDLAQRAKPQAEAELAEIRVFAAEELGLTELEPWDIPWAAERLRRSRFDFSAEDLRPWFPEDRVIPGLFAVVERLFGVTIREQTGVATWHPDVRFYAIHDEAGELRGQFYFDLYARRHKRGGAWMDECQVRRRHADGSLQVPVAYLTCNLTPPVDGQPARFTHDEVVTLFHEFGHGLHHMLTRVEQAPVSGINGVAWDAVELPSQFLENWCWQREALDLISGHWQTGEPIPDELFEKMTAARDFQAGMQMVRQLEFSLFDFLLHRDYDPQHGGRVLETLAAVRDELAVVVPPAWHRFPHSFGHIFAGGYAAGYYSYKWAEVLSADAFERFEQAGIFDGETGVAFRREVLEVGGSRDAMDSFVAFRGREPSVEPLLRHNGIRAA